MPIKYKEARIQKIIFEQYAKRALVVPNIYFRNYRYEADVIVFMKSGLTYEFEIKCSRADFRNEFKKRSKVRKHKYTGLKNLSHMRPNYYYFVSPENIIRPEELLIDDYGLIHITDGFYMKEIKKAKKLHDHRVSPDEYYGLARKMMYKLFNHSDRWKIRNPL